MKLYLKSLREGGNPLSETFPPEQLGLDGELFTQPVDVAGDVEWNGDNAEVRLHIVAPVGFLCDRCADEFTLSIETDATVQILMKDLPEGDDEDEHEGLIFAGKQGKLVDLADEIANAILLSVPLKRLCSEDCKGFCPQCYANLNQVSCEHVGLQDQAADEPRGETIADKLAKKQKR